MNNTILDSEGIELAEKISVTLSNILVEISESPTKLQTDSISGNESNESLLSSNQKIDQKLAEISNLFLQLRKINRQYGLASKNLKQLNHKELEECEVLFNKLQNNKGAIANIQQRIDSVKSQKSVYQEIPLVSEEELRANAPDYLKENIQDPHQLKLALLSYEVLLRNDLKKEKDELRLKKDTLLAKKRLRAEYIQRLQNQVNTYVKSADILRDALGMPQNPRK